jgi:uncharacterized membrane protein YhaH (DUF805 family)
MDWKYRLTNYEERINRGKFRACVGVIAAGAIVATIIDNIIGTSLIGLMMILGGIRLPVELGMLEGAGGANQYGPDPLAR